VASNWLTLVPCLTVLVLAVATRRTLSPLIAGCLVGYLLSDGWGFFSAFSETLIAVMQDETIAWFILVCGLFGSLINVLVISGGATAFGQLLGNLIRGRRSVLLMTWVMGLIIFFDDYLSALAVGTTMRRLADRFRVSREMLAYVVDSTAAPVCVLIPFSTWAFFVAGLLEKNGLGAPGEGLQVYITVIPFMLYAWFALLIVPLVAMGWIPELGPMRRVEAAARAGTLRYEEEILPEGAVVAEVYPGEVVGRAMTFIVPLVTLIVSTWFFDQSILKGILFTLPLAVLQVRCQGYVKFDKLGEGVMQGFQNMFPALAIVVISFVLKDVNDRLGLTNFIIETMRPWITKELLAAITFLGLSFVTFTTGSFWGTYAISLPILIPLAQEFGANLPLALGAVVSAGAFGSHACFYSDATVLSSVSSGCDNISHAITQLPYTLLGAALALIGFLVLGYQL